MDGEVIPAFANLMINKEKNSKLVNNMSQCAITDCENTEMAPVLYDGRVYCVEHYDQFIWDGFYTQYQSWKKECLYWHQ